MNTDLKIIVWTILLGFLVALLLFFFLTRNDYRKKFKKRSRSVLQLILTLLFFIALVGAGIYFLLLPEPAPVQPETTASGTVKFPTTGIEPAASTATLNAKSLYATPLDGLTTTSILLAIGFLGIASFQNVSARKRVEQDLEDAKIAARNVYEDLQVEAEQLAIEKAKDEALLESVGEGLVAVDIEGKIMIINQAACDMLGWKKKELIGKLITDLPLQDEAGEIVPLNKRPTTLALASREITKVTYFFVRKNKTRFPIAITATPIKFNGKTIGLIELIRDITREKEIERAKTEFVSLASHQLRTPLTGIGWLIELIMKKEKLTEKGKGYLNDILYSVHRSNGLVKLLLDTSRIESGSVGVRSETLELVDFIQKHLGEYRILCDMKKLSLVFTQHPEQLIVVTDVNLFEYILQNLISNAIDYTPANGKVEVILGKNKNSVLLSVKDTGIGIPAAEQAHLFEKFMRASNAVTTKTDGTGLGLYIAREAAKLLKGKIWAESPTFFEKTPEGQSEGKGSTFFVEFPLTSPSRAGGGGLSFVKDFVR